MREIKFRGKRIDNGEWVYGNFLYKKTMFGNRAIIIQDFIPCVDVDKIISFEINQWAQVIPETVGQYTGLKDKNDKEIYEGDILKNNDTLYVIRWCNCGFVGLKNNKHDFDIPSNMLCAYEWEIIGNIYENPELLEM